MIIGNSPIQLPESAVRTELLTLLSGITTSFKIESRVGGTMILVFDSFDVANLAKKALMNAPLGGRQITATWQESKSSTPGASGSAGAGSAAAGGSANGGRSDDPSTVTTLHISNIATAANEEDLRQLFNRFGEVSRPVIVKNALGEKRGFGFVTLPDREACVSAMRDLDQTEFFGQRIGVSLAKATSGSASSTIRTSTGTNGAAAGGSGGAGGRDGRNGGGRGGPDRSGRFERSRNDRSGPYSGGPVPSYYPPAGAVAGAAGAAAAYPYAGVPGYPPMAGAWPGYPAYDPNMYGAAAAAAAAAAPYYNYAAAAYDPNMYAAAAAAAAAAGQPVYGAPGPAQHPPQGAPAPPRYY